MDFKNLIKKKGENEMQLNSKLTRNEEQSGITLIALVVTIVVLLILAGVSVNALFGNSGIIEKAKEAQNKMSEATENDQKEIGELTNWLNNQVNGTTGGSTTGGDDTSTTPKISTLVGTVVDKNTKAEDTYGNKITIPKGFKILPHGTTAGSAMYTYSGNNIPAVQDGVVIENGTDGNQFVWVPVGIIKNKDNTTNTITLGRYSDFTMTSGTVASGQPVQVASMEKCTQVVTISNYFQELSTFREGNSKTDSTAQNATARNLETFIETSMENGGYYIARFEASGTTSKITSKYNQTVLTNITQPNAAKLAREMYGEVKENSELLYASDLVNSYAWDTAIIFIQTYSTGEDGSTYASRNKGPGDGKKNTGMSSDGYCNIWDMSGNVSEYTTEFSSYSSSTNFSPCANNGGYCNADMGLPRSYTSYRGYQLTTYTTTTIGLRSIVYVK